MGWFGVGGIGRLTLSVGFALGMRGHRIVKIHGISGARFVPLEISSSSFSRILMFFRCAGSASRISGAIQLRAPCGNFRGAQQFGIEDDLVVSIGEAIRYVLHSLAQLWLREPGGLQDYYRDGGFGSPCTSAA